MSWSINAEDADVSSASIFKVEFAGRHAGTARLSRRTCKSELYSTSILQGVDMWNVETEFTFLPFNF